MKRFLPVLILILFTSNINAQNKTTSSQSKIVDYFPPEPRFPGGQRAWNKFLRQNLKWPDKSGMIDVKGKVIVSFVVEKNGKLTNFKVERPLESQFDKEALRVIKLSPRWIPAKHNGKAYSCPFTIPIPFDMGY